MRLEERAAVVGTVLGFICGLVGGAAIVVASHDPPAPAPDDAWSSMRCAKPNVVLATEAGYYCISPDQVLPSCREFQGTGMWCDDRVLP